MNKGWVVNVSLHIEAASVSKAARKVYEDLWPLYGDRDMQIEGVFPSPYEEEVK